MDEILKRDQNSAVVLGGITDDSNEYIRMLRVDPTTNRLLVSGAGGTGVTQIIAGTNITISPVGGTGAVTINASGGGGSSGFQTPSGALNQGVFTFATAPNAIVVDSTPLQKTQQDGNSNWTGTTTITLTGAFPTFSIFGIA
jgi:hypothetical protein